jgi:2-hydroxychromene-2-carboxylate isomerase
MRTPAPQQAVLHLARAMERSSIDYAFMGGLAVTTWGIPRATFDLDLALGVDQHPAETLFQALAREDIEIDEHYRRGFVDRLSGPS